MENNGVTVLVEYGDVEKHQVRGYGESGRAGGRVLCAGRDIKGGKTLQQGRTQQ